MGNLLLLRKLHDMLTDEQPEAYLQKMLKLVQSALHDEEQRVARSIRVDSNQGGFILLPAQWMNAEQLTWFFNKNPDRKWRIAGDARLTSDSFKWLEALERAVGWPDHLYYFHEELIYHDLRSRCILHPKGGRGLGKSWWFAPIEDPGQWWTSTARPYYAEIYKKASAGDSLELVKARAVKDLADMTRESIEDGTFPFTQEKANEERANKDATAVA